MKEILTRSILKANSEWHTQRRNSERLSQVNTMLARVHYLDQTSANLQDFDGLPFRKKVKKGNLKQAARRVVIHTPMQLSIQDIHKRLKVCREKCKYYKNLGGDT